MVENLPKPLKCFWRFKEMVGRHRDFEIALQKLRGPNANIAREADEIKVRFEPKTGLQNRFRYVTLHFIKLCITPVFGFRFTGVLSDYSSPSENHTTRPY